ncbi:Bug family tripartite tricarboxylate transporter substrate binding protein [Pigmentiphaga kullae]|uniref:Tripartite-type tricarboxylate transporter receptor subunit TctC n=1 Tax=Pigmentiphaga kullae TaxID=151784 RepID=A0A4Q7NCN9_9BURK|nr:tripartite tricarboxylate transporter substrate binding protein [Pigmentiphaga kullae]RZS80407.1 tripartite-type tricarboxylate transporter receptor subunit TctC [Pigmentiphaga kullae]
MDRRTALKAAGGVAALSWTPALRAQEKYPSRPVRIVVQYPPGGVTDVAARLVGEVLTRKYGQPTVIENRPGASGIIGQQYVAGLPPDGYTLITGGLGGNVIPPVTVRNLPLDVVRSFVPIAQVAEFVNILVVPQHHPATSVRELIAHARRSPKPLSYGSNGLGTSVHLTSELFASTAGIDLMHVPYKGSNEALVDTVNGNLDFCFSNLPPVVPLLKSGKLRALAVTSSYRIRQLPEVPTMAEAGVQDFVVTSWLGIYGPAKMPAAIVGQLGRDIADGLRQPDMTARLEAAAFEPRPLDSVAFARVNQSELTRWDAIARRSKVALEFGQ